MAETNTGERWPSGGALERSDDGARTQKLMEVVIGSATAIALGVGCFFLGKFLLGSPPVADARKPDGSGPVVASRLAGERPAAERAVAASTSSTGTVASPTTLGADPPAARGSGSRESLHGIEEMTAVEESGATRTRSNEAAETRPEARKPAARSTDTRMPAAKSAPAKKPAAKAGTRPATVTVKGDSLTKAGTLKIEGATLCTSIKDRMPQGKGSVFSASAGKVFCWMRVVNGQGRKVRCVWTMAGKRFEGVWLDVGSPWWRTWASKKVDAGMRGKCKVEIQAEDGTVLERESFEVK